MFMKLNLHIVYRPIFPGVSIPVAVVNTTTNDVCCSFYSTQDEFVERMRAALPADSHGFRSFYSSLVGGVVTDPTLMVLPIDDHMVHRGHAGAKRCCSYACCVSFLDEESRADELLPTPDITKGRDFLYERLPDLGSPGSLVVKSRSGRVPHGRVLHGRVPHAKHQVPGFRCRSRYTSRQWCSAVGKAIACAIPTCATDIADHGSSVALGLAGFSLLRGRELTLSARRLLARPRFLCS